jgi:hypothetical protein
LVTSPNHLYKKLEEFGENHDANVKEMVEQDSKYLANSTTDTKPSAGFKLTIDNVDYRQSTHYMTEEHQNIDKHYVSINATTNRVSSSHLSDKVQTDGINHMENGNCIPSHTEQKLQRDNYVTLVQRVLVEHIPCLSIFKDIVQKHIPHKYHKETSKPTESVSFKNTIHYI